jgi:hypothetical protein
VSDNATESVAIPESVSALIPPALRTDLTLGLSYWIQGYSIHASARLSGCPKSTLFDHIRQLPEADKAARPKYMDEAAKLHYAIHQEAGRQLLEKLTTDELKPMELNAVYGTASDKLTDNLRVAALENTPGDGLSALLSHLGPEGGCVTVSVEPNRTVDVTPRGDGE